MVKPFTDIIEELRRLLIEDVVGALKYLQKLLPANSLKQDEIILLLGKSSGIRRMELQGTSTIDEIRRLDNEMRRDCLAIINDLTETDFDSSSSKKKTSSGFKGYLLYRIPRQMSLGVETRCIVRISINPDVLSENIKIDENTEQRNLNKVSKSMLIEMSDPSSNQNFDIRTTSKAVQTIDFDGEESTEWRFYVTPLREGHFVIEIKVCIIKPRLVFPMLSRKYHAQRRACVF